MNIVLLRPAEIAVAENLHTGSPISWEGKLARRAYEKDGNEQAVFEIVIAGNGAKLESVPKAASGDRPTASASQNAPAQ